MKKYLLLASVAGFLLAHNAMATVVNGQTSASINVSGVLTGVPSWEYNDVDFGTIVLSSSVENNDIIASFSGGELSYTDGKTLSHSGGETGWVVLSSATVAAHTFGITFDETVDLVSTSGYGSVVIAQMVNIRDGGGEGCSATLGDDRLGCYIDGDLKVTNKAKLAEYGGSSGLEGSITATLQF